MSDGSVESSPAELGLTENNLGLTDNGNQDAPKGPEIFYTGPGKERTPARVLIRGEMPEGFEIRKGFIGGKNADLLIDLDNLGEAQTTFSGFYQEYSQNPGLPLIEGTDLPTNLTAAIKAAQSTDFTYFGSVNSETGNKNVAKYAESPKRNLSDFKRDSSATCTEYSALDHQLFSSIGIDSEFISGGILNTFKKDETEGEGAETNHSYLILKSGKGNKQKIFLYDPVNYEIRTDERTGNRYSFPSVDEITPETYIKFIQRAEPISVERTNEDRDYWL